MRGGAEPERSGGCAAELKVNIEAAGAAKVTIAERSTVATREAAWSKSRRPQVEAEYASPICCRCQCAHASRSERERPAYVAYVLRTSTTTESSLMRSCSFCARECQPGRRGGGMGSA